ncbi:Ankyrin repeat protein 2 [Giardia muris]|uniref:Ankyrin repeat protein 2 n=1 Tax=Giardia muris TaxID=5742 RepID=A0A4Z1SPK5_GIAMU|nr:Ankyrin repeat protein 2 [Giardia muris]|eukprot:TNJ27754.1 Ankyrin repeat protein 2 [Giardia muris]
MPSKLIQAASEGDMEGVRQHLDLAGERDTAHLTALMHAARKGHEEVVLCIVERELGIRDADGRTALRYAVDNGHVGCARALLGEAGIRDSMGCTALMRAVMYPMVEMIALLAEKEACLQDCNGQTALMIASRLGYVDIVSLLCHREKMLRDANGWTALTHAVSLGQRECVEFLLKEMDSNNLRDTLKSLETINPHVEGREECMAMIHKQLHSGAAWKPITGRLGTFMSELQQVYEDLDKDAVVEACYARAYEALDTLRRMIEGQPKSDVPIVMTTERRQILQPIHTADEYSIPELETMKATLSTSLQVVESSLAAKFARTCVLCQEGPREILLRPCKHLCICEKCVGTGASPLMTCPICRATVENADKIFI